LSDSPLYISANSASGQALKDFQLTTDVKSKKDFIYGKEVAQNIYSTIYGNQTYFWIRNNRFRKNRQIANGKMDMSVFLDRLEMNGKANYVNINWKSIIIGNTIVSRLVGSWMKRKEKIVVTAVDPFSAKLKKESADEAEFVYQNKEVLAQLQQESGVPIIPQDQFIAEDKDELDRWISEFNHLPEEIQYSIGCNNVLEANGWNDVLKQRLLHDSAEVGLVCTYTFMDEEGEVHVQWIRPENAIYSYSDFPDFRDTTYRGHILSMKISEIRARYGKQSGGILSEEDIFERKCCQHSHGYPDQVNTKKHGSPVIRKDCPNQQYINRKTGAAGHERINKHGEETVIPTLNGTGGHNGRNVATKTHDQGNEGFSVKSDLMHKLVRNKCSTCHIAGIFHQGNKKE